MEHSRNLKRNELSSSFLMALTLILMLVLASTSAHAQDHSMKSPGSPDHLMIKPADIKWMDGPGSIPPGAKFAIIEGDTKAVGLFTMRLWMPAGYKIQAHWHPADEHITVISGTFMMGLGEKFENEKLQPLTTGSFGLMAKGTRHYAMVNEETIVQLHGMGPWDIKYVNPADDPRKK